jgi:WD40 repeat protein
MISFPSILRYPYRLSIGAGVVVCSLVASHGIAQEAAGTRHKGRVYAVAFSKDSQALASGGSGGAVRIWDVYSGNQLQALSGGSKSVSSLAFSPDGKWLACGNRDGTLRTWSVESWKASHTWAHPDQVSSVAFNPDGKVLASGSWLGTIKLWDVITGKEVGALGEPRPADFVWALAFDPAQDLLVSGGGMWAKLWHLGTGEIVAVLDGPPGYVKSVAFSPEGS